MTALAQRIKETPMAPHMALLHEKADYAENILALGKTGAMNPGKGINIENGKKYMK